MDRRAFATLVAGFGLAALAAPVGRAAEVEAEPEDCGCSGAKKNLSGRADSLYRRAMAETDLARRQRLLQLALKIDPEHAAAQAALGATQ
ncbi:MAG: hypothetical protein Kilf2KO_46540 [Rhodospirillales bacterium]